MNSLYEQTLAGSPHRHWQPLCTDQFFNEQGFDGLNDYQGLENWRIMGLFGLSTSEAILLTRQLNAEQERRNKETLRAINEQTEAADRQAKEGNKARLEAIGQIGAEARQLEPFITLHLEHDAGKVDRTIAIRPSDIREIKAMDDSYDTTDFDSPAPFGYYSKTIHRPYTEIILWSTKQIKVTETVEQIQEMVSQNIDRVSKIQAQILADAARMEDDV